MRNRNEKSDRRNARKLRRTRARIDAKSERDIGEIPTEMPTVSFCADISVEAGVDDTTPATINISAYSGGVMSVPGFGAVVVDLAGLKSKESIPILADHENRLSAVIGAGRPTNKGQKLQLSGTISRSSVIGQQVIDLARDGVQLQASIGATPMSTKRVQANTPTTVNGRTIRSSSSFLLISKAKLREVSIVPAGADDTTSVEIAASLSPELSDMNFQSWLKAEGWSSDTLSEDQLNTLRAAYDALDDDTSEQQTEEVKATAENDATPETVTADIRAAAAAEATRINNIRTLVAIKPEYQSAEVDGVSIEAHAISNDWTAERTELELLRTTRSKAPAAHISASSTTETVENLQAAMLLRSGVNLNSSAWKSQQAIAMKIPSWLRAGVNDDQCQRALETGHKYSSMSAVDLCKTALHIQGRTVPVDRQEMIQAAFSTQTLTDIFTTNVNAVLLSSFMEATDTTGGWTSTADVANFLTLERPRMAVGPGLSKLSRGSEAEHVVRSDSKESYKIARYAKQFVVDDQDIVDDRLNALSSLPGDMGNAAARLRPDLVYSILLANGNLDATSAALFTGGQNNLNTSSALAQATVTSMMSDMATHQENSANLNIMATHLIVPQALRHTARQIVNSQEIQAGGSSVGNLNPILAEGLSVASDARLDNGVTSPDSGTAYAGSATTWFAASANTPTIEVGYLAGTGRAPMVRSFSLDSGKWGIGWDVKLDIGAKALDYRGLHKSTA